MEVKKHIELLGYKAEDKITGYKGVIDSISFDLYGCVQASIRPPMNEMGELPNGYWVDVTRLKIMGKKPVVDAPNFDYGYVAEGKKGPADKPTNKL